MQSVKKKNEEVVEEIKELNKDADVSSAKDSDVQVGDVQGTEHQGTPIKASYSGREYYMRPCPLSKIPELVGYIKKLEEHMEKNIAPTDILIAEDGIVLKHMAEVIRLGIMKDSHSKTAEQIMDEFTLGDFPKVYKTALDINDFLAGMSNIYQPKNQGK